MASQNIARNTRPPIAPEAKQARRKRVDELIGKLTQGIAEGALSGEGSLEESDIVHLERELRGMRIYIDRKLSRAKANGVTLSANALFTDNPDRSRELLLAWSTELAKRDVSDLAQRAVTIHYLILDARASLLAAREAHQARGPKPAGERVKIGHGEAVGHTGD